MHGTAKSVASFATFLAVFLIGALAAPTVATAQQLTWEVQSMYPNKVQIEFYSQDRRHAWPGGNRAYNLNDYETHTYRLNCIAGEKICYGAWVTGNSSRYWGVGMNNRHGCKGCCYTCDDNVAEVRLVR